MFEPIDPKNTCIGKPTGKGVFESAQGGNSPCSASEVCNYFDTVKGEYSEEGCETVPTADGSMACVCDHLSEFVSLKVPTSFDDKIQFASLDVPTELCLHCACSKSIELMLEKSAVASESVLVDQTVDLLNIADDTKFSMFWTSMGERGNGTKVAWRLHNMTETHDHFLEDSDDQPALPPPSSPLAPGS